MTNAPSEDDDIIREFILESRENLNRLDQDFIALERAPSDSKRLSSIFRTIHTIKGTCGYLNFAKLGALAHAGETLLDRLRTGALSLNGEITTTLLAMVDAIRVMLVAVEKERHDGASDYHPLIAKLETLAAGQAAVVDALVDAVFAPVSAGAPNALRVQVDLLDRLMNLSGELVLARNHLLKQLPETKGTALGTTLQQLNLVTTSLQDAVMKTRMQRIGLIWQTLPRVVRDLALECGKKVRLDMAGEDTDLDKTLLEAIKDPLLHAVRNAVDHGIETPEARAACGKPPVGVIALRAFHEAGYVVVELRDDGAGLNVARIRQKGLTQGLISPEQSALMTDRDIVQLIFAPGFSTAEKVTEVSGRGVGMDVVKTNIEKIGGTVDIQSQPGASTTLKLRIPLTLAVIPALIVSSRGERYAIPQANLLELLRLEPGSSSDRIEDFCGTPVYRLRGRLLPLIDLGHILKLSGQERRADQNASVMIVVLKAEGRPFGLVVERIHDTEEIVVKPLGRLLKGLGCYAGAAIMGDGSVALILDVTGLARAANVTREIEEPLRGAREDEASGVVENQQKILLFQIASGDRMGIPLGRVARLEELAGASVERSHGRNVTQYRGQIMPLIDLSAILGEGAAMEKETLHVIIYARDGRSMGFVVESILDIVTQAISLTRTGEKAGILGSAVIQGRVTDLLDVDGLAQSLNLDASFDPLEKAA